MIKQSENNFTRCVFKKVRVERGESARKTLLILIGQIQPIGNRRKEFKKVLCTMKTSQKINDLVIEVIQYEMMYPMVIVK